MFVKCTIINADLSNQLCSGMHEPSIVQRTGNSSCLCFLRCCNRCKTAPFKLVCSLSNCARTLNAWQNLILIREPPFPDPFPRPPVKAIANYLSLIWSQTGLYAFLMFSFFFFKDYSSPASGRTRQHQCRFPSWERHRKKRKQVSGMQINAKLRQMLKHCDETEHRIATHASLTKVVTCSR
jgi:hypothetical protein